MIKIAATSAFLAMMTTAASASVVDMFDLDVTSAAGTNSSAILELGQVYNIQISGTFKIGSNPTRHIADAEFINLGSTPLAPIDTAGVGIDGVDVEFGAFNPFHVYNARFVGTGSTINLFFRDSNYSDNSGSLSVKISAVPLPAGLVLLLSGLGGLGIARRRAA